MFLFHIYPDYRPLLCFYSTFILNIVLCFLCLFKIYPDYRPLLFVFISHLF